MSTQHVSRCRAEEDCTDFGDRYPFYVKFSILVGLAYVYTTTLEWGQRFCIHGCAFGICAHLERYNRGPGC